MHVMRTVRCWAAAMVVGLGLAGAALAVETPKVTRVAGPPMLRLGAFDLKAKGYVVEEFFLAGTAQSYRLAGEASVDGRWQAEPAATSDYATRIVVVRPEDARRFNGTVAVEWLNVTGGLDAAPDWSYTHRELLRNGYAWVGVSAQRVGVEGGSRFGSGGALKLANPARYGALSHPGDGFSFDMFSQAGRVVDSGQVLGGLKAGRVLAMGESQSAAYLTTYVNALDPLAKVYDGFLIHSRSGSAALLAASGGGGPAGPRAPADSAATVSGQFRFSLKRIGTFLTPPTNTDRVRSDLPSSSSVSRRGSSSSKKIRISILARCWPRQTWGPKPNARCGLGERSIRNSNGSANASSSRLAEG